MKMLGDKDLAQKMDIKFFVRVFPTVEKCTDIKVEDNRVLYVPCLEKNKPGSLKKDVRPKFWRFETDGIFRINTQEEVYNGVMGNTMERVLGGHNAVVLGCGQTGTGKSLTMAGLNCKYKHRGLALQALTYLFGQKTKLDYMARLNIQISYVEFHGTKVTDLLRTLDNKHYTGSLKQSITRVPVEDEGDALRLLFKAATYRSYDNRAPYPSSNAGHAVITIYTEYVELLYTGRPVKTGKIHFVDLAGMDLVGSPTSIWKSAREIGLVNSDKIHIEQFFIELSERLKAGPVHQKTNKGHQKLPYIPSRQSHLIHYISDGLVGSSVIRIVGHINGTSESLKMTLSTLRFGQMVRGETETEPVHLCTKPPKDPKLQAAEIRKRNKLEAESVLAELRSNCHVSEVNYNRTRAALAEYLSDEDLESSFILGESQLLCTKQEAEENAYEAERVREEVEKDEQAGEVGQKTKKRELTRELSVEEMEEIEVPESNLSVTIDPSMHFLSEKQRVTLMDVKEVDEEARGVSSRDDVLRQMESLEPIKEGVGETDRKGIGIGPGFVSSYVGEVTRALRKQRADRLTLDTKRSCKFKLPKISPVPSGIPVSKHDIAVEIHRELYKDIDSRHLPWVKAPRHKTQPEGGKVYKRFLKSSRNVIDMKQSIDELSAKSFEVHKHYLSTSSQLTKSEVALESANIKLMLKKKKKHLTSFNIFKKTKATEIEMVDIINKKRSQISVNQKALEEAKIELRICMQKLTAMKRKLEHRFKEFCISCDLEPRDFMTYFHEQMPEAFSDENIHCQEYQVFQVPLNAKTNEIHQKKPKWR